MPILQKQEVRETFEADVAAFNRLIFESVDPGAIEATDLNADVDLMVRKLSERMSDGASQLYLREYIVKAFDPVGEEAASEA